ncbi:MAG: hypothetical protein K5873_05140 [Treponema sp.]|nr:hypothetical protein [Treponema sp.]
MKEEVEKQDITEESPVIEELEAASENEEYISVKAANPNSLQNALSSPENKDKTISRKKSSRLPPLLRLSRRTTVFLSLTLLASIIFFVTGNKQSFLDSNLNMILKTIACNSIALSIFSSLDIIQCLFFTFYDKRFKLIFHLIVYLAILLISITVTILSLTVNLLSEGFAF